MSRPTVRRKFPDWGFSSSPLLVGDLVIIAAEGKLVAYDLATGAPRWFGPAGGAGYSSPHLLTIDGVAQILLLNGGGVTSVTPADGKPSGISNGLHPPCRPRSFNRRQPRTATY